MGTNHYRKLQKGFELKATCETDDWIQGSISNVEGKKVNWESGWVEKKYTNKSQSQDIQQGLYWDIESMDSLTPFEKSYLKLLHSKY